MTGNNYTVSVYDPFKLIDNMWNTVTSSTWTPQDTYPPYNIREIDEDTRVLELALAGFTKNEVKVEMEEEKLRFF